MVKKEMTMIKNQPCQKQWKYNNTMANLRKTS